MKSLCGWLVLFTKIVLSNLVFKEVVNALSIHSSGLCFVFLALSDTLLTQRPESTARIEHCAFLSYPVFPMFEKESLLPDPNPILVM